MLLFFTYTIVILYLFFALCLGCYFIHSIVIELLAHGVPFVPSYDSDLKTMREKLKLHPGKTMIDLGCGDGKALRFFTREYSLTEGHGYDLHLLAVLWGNFINKFKKISQVRLFVGNFLRVDFSKYDYVYIYLLTSCLESIEDQVFDTIGERSIIISNTFKFKKHAPYEIICDQKGKPRIYLYKKNS